MLKLPLVPGFEVCGEVLEVGRDVTTMTVGSKVIGMNKEGLGGFAEECITLEQVKLKKERKVLVGNRAEITYIAKIT